MYGLYFQIKFEMHGLLNNKNNNDDTENKVLKRRLKKLL